MPNSKLRYDRLGSALALIACLLFMPLVAAAEEARAGTIAGKVVSTTDGRFVASALVMVPGTGLSTNTDLNGDYRISNVPVGTHTLRVMRAGFRMSRVEGVQVAAGKLAKADVPLESLTMTVTTDDAPAEVASDGLEIVELDALVVTTEVAEGSALALLGEREKAAQVSDAIGSDFMSRVDAGDAAEALSKITGASIVDGKYVLIRGLGDRYSNTLLNGTAVPSADPDRRAVQMDQFPSSLLESIVTNKSFTPDQPGGFTGGSVDLRTKNFPENFFVSSGTSIGYNSQVTSKRGLVVPGGGQDWLGRDDGTRALPADLPDSVPSETQARLAARRGDFVPAQELDAVSKLFHNETYFPARRSAAPNFSGNISVGDRFDLGDDKLLGYIVSLTYNRSTSHFEGGTGGRFQRGVSDPNDRGFVDGYLNYSPDVSTYDFAALYEANPEVPGGTPEFGVAETSQNVDWGAYAQAAFRPSLNHEVSLRYLHTQSASDRIKHGVGEATRSESGRLYELYELLYTERSIDSIQLAGSSLFPSWNDLRVEWRVSHATSTQEQPDYRTISSFWDFVSQQYASASGVGSNRFFRNLEEERDEIAADFTLPTSLFGRHSTLKFGGVLQDGNRTNRERRFRWTRQGSSRDIIEKFPHPVGIIAQTSDSVTFGNVITEVPSNLVNYDGEQRTSAWYAMVDVPVSETWRANFGVRAEGTEISTRPGPNSANFRTATIDDTDWLPALNVVHQLNEGMSLRAAYGRTIARPLYRELADIRVEDVFNDEYFAGNPDLKLTMVDNLDLRWEWFRGRDDVVAVSAFYKYFSDPIEVVTNPATSATQPQNVEEGEVLGLEFEARAGLGSFSDRLTNFSVGGNVSLIESRVSIPRSELVVLRTVFPEAPAVRELLGQSPYVVNIDFAYSNLNSGTSLTLAYNVTGERLSLVTLGPLPDVYEQPAPQLDFIASQRLNRRWKLKFAAKNLLDPSIERTVTHLGTNYFYDRHKRGRSFSLGLSYLFE